jgi:hypothetical protein
MDSSIRRRPCPSGPPDPHPPHRETIDFGPIPGAAGATPRRARIERSRVPLWSRRGIVRLLLGVIVLPWLPIFGPSREATPAERVRGVGDAPLLSLAFAPDGATIATIQINGRVALQDAAGGGGHSFLDHRGYALALAFSPDGRSLAVGGAEPDVFVYDLGAGGAGRPSGMPIRWVKLLAFSPTADSWPRRVTTITRSSSGTSPRGGSGPGCGATFPP